MGNILKKGFLFLLSVMLVFGALEILIRSLDIHGTDLYVKDALIDRRHKSDLDMTIRTEHGKTSHVITNQFGFLGHEVTKEKSEGVFRVVNLGDSFTAGHDVDTDKTYSSLLEETLPEVVGMPVESLNFGIPSQGTHEALLRYERFAENFEPDLVILYFFVGNDFAENQESITELKEKLEHRDDGSLLRRTFRKSELALFVVNKMVQIPSIAHFLYGTSIIRDEGESDNSSFSEIPISIRVMFSESDPDKNEITLRNTREDLTLLYDEVKKTGATLLVVVIPTSFQVVKGEGQDLLTQYPLLTDAGFDFTRPQRSISEMLMELSIPSIDLLPTFQEKCSGDSCALYNCPHCHLSEEGHILVRDEVTLKIKDLLENKSHATTTEKTLENVF